MSAPITGIDQDNPLDRASMGARHIDALALVIALAMESDSEPSRAVVTACLSLVQYEAKAIEDAIRRAGEASRLNRRGKTAGGA